MVHLALWDYSDIHIILGLNETVTAERGVSNTLLTKKNLDLIRLVVCQSGSEHIQTAATLIQQSFSNESWPSQEK